MNDKIICLVGESGSGKSTIAELLEKEGYNYIQSYTTRKPRYEGEKGHIFTDDASRFYEDIYLKNEYIAYTYFDGHHYFATKEQYQGKGTSIYVVDVTGIKKLKQRVKDAEIVVIYLKCEQHTRWDRMCWRKHKDTNIADFDIWERIDHDKEAFKIVECNYVVDANRPIENVLKDIKSLI